MISILSHISPFRLVFDQRRFFGFITVFGMIIFMVLGFEGVFNTQLIHQFNSRTSLGYKG